MSAKKYHYPFTVLETHLDAFAHMNNATYLVLFEEARWDMLNQRNYGVQRIFETQISPIILELNIRYKRELRLRQKIVIETQILSYTGKIGKLLQEMKDE